MICMENKLLEVLEVANDVNKKQDKVYAQVIYTANDIRSLELAIRSKKDFSYVEKCEVQLKNQPIMKLETLISVLKSYLAGGVTNE